MEVESKIFARDNLNDYTLIILSVMVKLNLFIRDKKHKYHKWMVLVDKLLGTMQSRRLYHGT